VADWVCSGSRQHGKHNLAVFYTSCTLDCLFCQNWHFREVDNESAAGTSARAAGTSARELAEHANEGTYCVCFFGGDPASQMPHALASARALAERGVVICWETAGTAHPKLMDRAVRYSLETGGCLKFDLKAYTESVHVALTGWSNRQTFGSGQIPRFCSPAHFWYRATSMLRKSAASHGTSPSLIRISRMRSWASARASS
jgi:pyruvate formate lyase activating enzyme